MASRIASGPTPLPWSAARRETSSRRLPARRRPGQRRRPRGDAAGHRPPPPRAPASPPPPRPGGPARTRPPPPRRPPPPGGGGDAPLRAGARRGMARRTADGPAGRRVHRLVGSVPARMDWKAEGLLEGLEDDDARDARRQLLDHLHGEGCEIDELRAAVKEDRLVLLPVERFLAGEVKYSQRDIADEAGLDLDQLAAFRQALG